MNCAIYQSERKADTYLYVVDSDDKESQLKELPEALLKPLGELVHVMDLDLEERKSLARADIDEVRRGLQEKGFYLQLPPSSDELAKLENRLSKL